MGYTLCDGHVVRATCRAGLKRILCSTRQKQTEKKMNGNKMTRTLEHQTCLVEVGDSPQSLRTSHRLEGFG